MGVDIHVRIVFFDRNYQRWEEAALYKKFDEKNYYKIDPYEGRDYELFDLLSHKVNSSPIVTSNLPVDLSNEITKWAKEIGSYGFSEINLADLKLYLIDNPTVPDYNSDEEGVFKTNPIADFISIVTSYLNFAEGFSAPTRASEVRILYWFDR